MKWILFMTLLYRGAALDHLELETEADCRRMAQDWVASQPKSASATAFCLPKYVKPTPKPDGLK